MKDGRSLWAWLVLAAAIAAPSHAQPPEGAAGLGAPAPSERRAAPRTERAAEAARAVAHPPVAAVEPPAMPAPPVAAAERGVPAPVPSPVVARTPAPLLPEPAPEMAPIRPAPLAAVIAAARAGPESGAMLARPAPSADVQPTPPPVARGTEPPFVPGVRATARSPVTCSIGVSGDGGPAAALLAADLELLGELRVGEDEPLVEIEATGEGGAVVLRASCPSRPDSGSLTRSYRGAEPGLARFVHDYADELVLALTGARGPFRSRLIFARRTGPGQKDVWEADADGTNLRRISSGRQLAMLPGFGTRHIWYSIVTQDSMFITHTGNSERPVIEGPGLHMGVTLCGQRLLFASTRDGNSEIHSAALDGTDIRRLTDHPAIDVSPTCGPDGRIAFVSDRSGSPQIWSMEEGERPRQLTREEGEGQTPIICSNPERPLLAYTRIGDRMGVVVMDLRARTTTVVAQGRGEHKDPAFSPDCRLLAYVSPEGIVVSSLDGRRRRLVVPGPAETVRWAR